MSKVLLIALVFSAGCASIGYNSNNQHAVLTHTVNDGLTPIKTETYAMDGNGSAFSTGLGINFNAIPGGNDSFGYGGFGYGGYGYGGGMPMAGAYSLPVIVTTPIVDYPAPVLVTSPATAGAQGATAAQPDQNTAARLAAVEKRQSDTETDVHKLKAVESIGANADKPQCAEFLKNPDGAGLEQKQKDDAVAACKTVLGIK